MANLTITLDDEDKKGIAEFCEQVGMTISGLYNVFTKQVLREGRIPFEIGINTPNRETIKAMKEGDKIYEKFLKNPSKVKTYTVNEAIREMKSWQRKSLFTKSNGHHNIKRTSSEQKKETTTWMNYIPSY